MAQNTKTWSSLEALVQARIGTDLSSKSTTRLQALANSAAQMLYDENPWWERFLVLEPRTVERGYISYDEDSFNVYGAGTSDANGLYVRVADVESLPAYSMQDADENAEYTIQSDGAGGWELVEISSGDILYVITSASVTPPEGAWDVDTGESPAPIIQALSEIGEYIGHWNGAVFQCAGATPGTAYPDQNGIRVTNCSTDGTVYVAYKKTLTDIYGDGQSGTTSAIPAEWHNYMALQTASAWTGSQKDSTVRVADIDKAWEQALLKINRQGIYNNIASRFRTYYGCDVSVR